jgi:ribose transport system permease protein
MSTATDEPQGRVASLAARLPTGARERLAETVSQVAAAGALIVIFVYLSFAAPDFLTSDNLFNVGAQTAVTAIIAMGMTLVIITAGIDLSVGAVSALAGVVGAKAMSSWGIPVIPSIVVGVLIGSLCGVINGTLITFARMAPFIATLGMMSVARGALDVSTNAVAVFGLPDSFQLLGQGQVGPIPIPVIAILVVAIIGHLILTRTKLGRYSYAIGSNEEAARLSGIPIKLYLTVVYTICGALAGFGGMIAASRVSSGQPNFGIGLELDVIAAAVIGGASLFGGQGTIVGTLIGAFLIALIRNGSVLLDINTFVQSIVIGVVIWLAVMWDGFRRRKLQAGAD